MQVNNDFVRYSSFNKHLAFIHENDDNTLSYLMDFFVLPAVELSEGSFDK